jgi:hypothetical protein
MNELLDHSVDQHGYTEGSKGAELPAAVCPGFSRLTKRRGASGPGGERLPKRLGSLACVSSLSHSINCSCAR